MSYHETEIYCTEIKIYKTIIFLVVLYGCETWSLKLRKRHRLNIFENRVLRRIFGTKRDEITGGWRKLHNEELHNMYYSPSIIRTMSRKMRSAGHVASMGRKGMHIRVLWETQKERYHQEDVDGKIILKWILEIPRWHEVD
jgi:hypothetical protein